MSDSATSRFVAVTAAIASATASAGRPLGSVGLIAVSKTFGASAIEPVLYAGQRRFGENRVQEAKGKWPALRQRYPDIELHLIGPLQSNKVADAVALFDVIQTLDRPKLANALASARLKHGRCPRLLIQVNTGDEPQKSGIAVADLAAFLDLCRATLALPVEGLMCIPPIHDDPRPHFRLLAGLARDHGLPTLSMGMSSDFPTAIAEGATLVRIGSAIFGGRG